MLLIRKRLFRRNRGNCRDVGGNCRKLFALGHGGLHQAGRAQRCREPSRVFQKLLGGCGHFRLLEDGKPFRGVLAVNRLPSLTLRQFEQSTGFDKAILKNVAVTIGADGDPRRSGKFSIRPIGYGHFERGQFSELIHNSGSSGPPNPSLREFGLDGRRKRLGLSGSSEEQAKSSNHRHY